MARLSDEDVRQLARLARLGLNQDRINQLKPELDAILDYVEQLQRVDTKNIQPTSQVTGLTDVWREDKVVPAKQTRAELLNSADLNPEGFIKVRRVL